MTYTIDPGVATDLYVRMHRIKKKEESEDRRMEKATRR
jgi:hypothetical protein